MAIRVIKADVLDGLRQLPDESVHCCVTSPPYFGLRDYGVEGQIGLEKSPGEYVTRMVDVFRELRRVLRADGVLFLNIGDSYANDGKWGGSTGGKHVTSIHGDTGIGRGKRETGLKPKDLIGIPWRLAFALQDDGWWLRGDYIWQKPNPMPESVTDRCTKAHEYVFHLTKSEKYFWDQDAIKERADYGFPNSPESIASPYGQGFTRRASSVELGARPPGTAPQSGMKRQTRKAGNKSHKYVTQYEADDSDQHRTKAGLMKVAEVEWMSRNKRSVWTIATTPFPEAHFATFPPELPEICIKAGTSGYGCCSKCGAPWVRVMKESAVTPDKTQRKTNHYNTADKYGAGNGGNTGFDKLAERMREGRGKTTSGWKQACDCENNQVVPAVVLDPFAGAGTTGMVADRLGRDAVLIELNPEYAKIIKRRIARDRLQRKAGSMADVAAAELDATPLEVLMAGGAT